MITLYKCEKNTVLGLYLKNCIYVSLINYFTVWLLSKIKSFKQSIWIKLK